MRDNPYQAEPCPDEAPRPRRRVPFEILTLLFLAIGLAALLGIPLPGGRPLTPAESWRSGLFGGLSAASFALALLVFLVWVVVRVADYLRWFKKSGPRGGIAPSSPTTNLPADPAPTSPPEPGNR